MGNKDQDENLLKGLAEFIAEGHAYGGEQERLDDEIKAAGIDTKEYLSQFKAQIDSGILKRRQEIHADRLSAGSRIITVIQKVKEKLAHMTTQDKETWVAALEPHLADAYCRNFTSASSADKASMLEDLALLEKLDELMKEDGK